MLDAKAPMVMDRNFKPGFRIDLHIKDLANALDTSHGVGAQLPLTAAVMWRATTKNWRKSKLLVNDVVPGWRIAIRAWNPGRIRETPSGVMW